MRKMNVEDELPPGNELAKELLLNENVSDEQREHVIEVVKDKMGSGYETEIPQAENYLSDEFKVLHANMIGLKDLLEAKIDILEKRVGELEGVEQ